MRGAEDRKPICTFGYIDESATSQRFFGCGLLLHGPCVSGADDKHLNEHIRQLKVQAGIRPRGDVSWKKTPNRDGNYLGLYRRYIDGFFCQPNLAFFALVVDTHRYPLDAKAFFRGSKDAGIDAFTFHLLRSHLLNDPGGSTRLRLRFDRRVRPARHSLQHLVRRLRQSGTLSGGGTPLCITFRSVTGGRHPLLQVADILLGCVTASLNAAARSQGKLALLAHLEERLGRKPAEATPPWEKKFNVWHFEAGKRADKDAEPMPATLQREAR